MLRMISASINGRGGFDLPVSATDNAETYDKDGTCFSRKSMSATRPNSQSWRKTYDPLAPTLNSDSDSVHGLAAPERSYSCQDPFTKG